MTTDIVERLNNATGELYLCAAAEIERLRARSSAVEALYEELLFAVSKKYPGESRHQTALRYIQQECGYDETTGNCTRVDCCGAQQGEPVAWMDARDALQQAYLALEDLQGPGFLIGGVMHYRIGLILPKLNDAIDALAAAPQQRQPLGECDECGTPYSFDPTDGGSICVRCIKEAVHQLRVERKQQRQPLSDADLAVESLTGEKQ